jgi:hypothetical protein
MITIKCEPLNARFQFECRNCINWAITFGLFFFLMYALRLLPEETLSDFAISCIAVGSSCLLFFVGLYNRAIAIECPNSKCSKYIETNTPWKCGNPSCRKDNLNVDDHPVIGRCEHCKVQPKAFECPHCREPIFLSKDKLKSIYASFINTQEPVKATPVEKDIDRENIEKQKKDIELAELKVQKANLDLQFKEINKNLEPVKIKSLSEKLREKYKNVTELDEEQLRLMTAVNDQFPDTPENHLEREKRFSLIKGGARDLSL